MLRIEKDTITPDLFKFLKLNDIFFICSDIVNTYAYMKIVNDYNYYNAVNLHNGQLIEISNKESVVKTDKKLDYYFDIDKIFFADLKIGDYFWLSSFYEPTKCFIKVSYNQGVDLHDAMISKFHILDQVSLLENITL